MDRRTFLYTSIVASLAASLRATTGGRRAPRILLYNGWQSENIGDVAHTPGILALIEKYIPEAEVTFWSYYFVLPNSKRAILQKRFPKLKIIEGVYQTDQHTLAPAVAEAMERADFMLHGSGPSTVGWRGVTEFRRRTGRPFGVYGVTYGLYGKPERELLSSAEFVYSRDSVSLQTAKDDGINAKTLAWGPDAVFAVDVRNDAKAQNYLDKIQFKSGKYMVCIPKQRHTPAWLHKPKNRPFDPERHARNEAMAEHDHLPLRQAIVSIVRETDLNIIIGHEDETELPIGKTWVWDHLPDDVRSRVVWRDTLWDLDEAMSLYAHSAGMFSNEMHSPIMCISLGIPAIVNRWEEQSSKGIMWRDIGLGDWLFDFDRPDEVARMPAAALAMAKDPAGSKAKALHARTYVHEHFAKSMSGLNQLLGKLV